MNFVRRSLGAVALTFCGMLSLHADTAAVVQPVTDIVVNADHLGQNVTDFKAALKQVLANTLKTSLIDQEADFHRSSVRTAIADKQAELIAASTDANQAVVNAGFKTVETVEVEAAAAAFEAQLVILKTFPKDVAHDSVVNYMNAVKATVAQKDMITVLNIAKKCNGADAAALLKLRDELKVGKDAVKIVGTVNAKNVNAYIAKFTKQMAKIATMTAAQAGHAHKYTLAEARIVARAAREAGLANVNHDAFDAQIAQAKAGLKARFVVANQEIVDSQAAALVKKAQPGLMSKVGNGLTTVGYHLTVTPAKTAWWAVTTPLKGAYNFCCSGKKGGNEVGDIEAPAVNDFAQVMEALEDLDATQADKVATLQVLRAQAEAINGLVQEDTFAPDAQRGNLVLAVQTIIQKFITCFENTQAALDFMDTQAKGIQVRAHIGKTRTTLITQNNVRIVLGDQADFLLNDFTTSLNEIYNAANARANQL